MEIKKYCCTCKWYSQFEGVCCNGESEHRAYFRFMDDTCEQWETNTIEFFMAMIPPNRHASGKAGACGKGKAGIL